MSPDPQFPTRFLIPVGMKQLASVIGLCLVLIACEQKRERLSESKELQQQQPVTVSGQVFIVTDGRENIKLALVPVRVYDKDVYENLALANARYEADVLKWQAEAAAAEPEYKRLKETLKEKESDVETLDKEIAKDEPLLARLETGTLEYNFVMKRLNITKQEKYRASLAVQETIDKLEPKAIQLAAIARALQKTRSEFIVKELDATPIAEPKSDVDGKFQLKLKPGSYYFVAKASRRIAAKEETYNWVVPQTVGTEDTLVLLSNDNLGK